MNITSLNLEDCCGCGACYDACPCDAIFLSEDRLGFYYPRVEGERCVDCGRCVSKCPVLGNPNVPASDHSAKEAYAGYYRDEDELIQSSSGGAATALSERVINEGGVVFGVQYSNDFRPVWDIARSIDELKKFRGSKYAESTHDGIYKAIEKELSQDKLVLVIGLPHDIAAIRSYLEGNSDAEKLFLCDLICSSVPSQKLLIDYIKEKEQICLATTECLSLRYKKEGNLLPAYIRFSFSNGEEYLELSSDSLFQQGFNLVKRPSCYNCRFKGDDSVADLTLGDYWGIQESDIEYNRKGVSLILERTPKGRKLLDMLDKDVFFLLETDLKSAVKYNHLSYRSAAKSKYADMFAEYYAEYNLAEACAMLLKKQKEERNELVTKLDPENHKIALWGAGGTADALYESLHMGSWDISCVFDSNPLKIGKYFHGTQIYNINEIACFQEQFDILAICITSTISKEELEMQLKYSGYFGEFIYLGEYRNL